MQLINDILNHPKQESIEQRLKVIDFCDEFGFEATRKAFDVSRSTVYLWKKKLALANGKLSGLAPGDKTPHRKRRRMVQPYIESFIIGYRASHPGVDKATITPLLKAACEKAGVRPPSESTVGRIIHDLKERGKLTRATKAGIDARTGKLHIREPRRPAKKARRQGFRPVLPGDLVQIDSVEILADGIKRYLITAIDLPTRFAFAYTYKSSSSAHTSDFLGKLKSIAPFTIARVQTDNGHEFLKHFARSCEDSGLTHFFNYPRHPQSNGHLERFNRTIQEQFAYWNLDAIDEPDIFNRRLMRYLLWYNTERPHRAIGKMPPLRYYVENFVTHPEKSNMYWTLTHS